MKKNKKKNNHHRLSSKMISLCTCSMNYKKKVVLNEVARKGIKDIEFVKNIATTQIELDRTRL